jgi:hypothetical protein
MRSLKADLLLLPVILAATFLVLLPFAILPLVGFLGIAVLGLLVGLSAILVDLEKEGAVGGSQSPHLYAQQMIAQESMTRSERAAHRSEMKSLMRPLFVTKVISGGLFVVGLGGIFLFDLGK